MLMRLMWAVLSGFAVPIPRNPACPISQDHRKSYGTCPGCPSVSRDSGTGRTVGLWPSTVGHMGPVRDVLVCPGTLGREGQWDCGPPLWDTWDLSGMS